MRRHDDTRPHITRLLLVLVLPPFLVATETYRCSVALKGASRKTRRLERVNSTSILLFGTTEEISMNYRVETLRKRASV